MVGRVEVGAAGRVEAGAVDRAEAGVSGTVEVEVVVGRVEVEPEAAVAVEDSIPRSVGKRFAQDILDCKSRLAAHLNQYTLLKLLFIAMQGRYTFRLTLRLGLGLRIWLRLGLRVWLRLRLRIWLLNLWAASYILLASCLRWAALQT